MTAIDWGSDLDAALERGRSERRPVLLYIAKDPCPECSRLSEETLSEAEVAAAIVARFVPVKLLLGQDREAARRYGVFWTPTLYFLDADGEARHESPGWLAPSELLPVLSYGEARAVLRRGRLREAAELLGDAVDRWPESGIAPEALYWLGNVEYVLGGGDAALERARSRLRRDYPDSLAARRF